MKSFFVSIISVFVVSVFITALVLREKLKDAIEASLGNLTYNYNNEHILGVYLNVRNKTALPISVKDINVNIISPSDKQIATVSKKLVKLEPGKTKEVSFYIKDIEFESGIINRMLKYASGDCDAFYGYKAVIELKIYGFYGYKKVVEL